MPDEPRVRQLLEDLLESGRTPEDVCADDPELLSEVRNRLDQIRRVQGQIDEIFPSPGATKHDRQASSRAWDILPPLEGHDVEGVLGRGGMGVVYRARHRALNRPVAVKMLLAGAYAGPQELGRFQREAEAVGGLRHPNIVQVYDAGDIEGRPFFTMELVEGGSLARQLGGTPQPAKRAAELVATLAGAVQFAHRSGIIHRDLKPANILVTADGTLKITDFGLARAIDGEDRFTLPGARVGTPRYMAPEQALGKVSAIGPAVDIYALGAILYELLTGRPPFVGESPSETERRVIADEPVPPSRLNANLPRDLETICLKCLQKNPTRRYASAQDLADDLHRFLDGKPVLARPVGVVERMAKWARRRPALATLTTGLFLSLAAASGTGLWLHQHESVRKVEKASRQRDARRAIETVIDQAYKSGKAERWQEANVILAEAKSHLANADSDQLRTRIERAGEDLRFAQKLERIRQSAVSSVAETKTSSPHFMDFQLLATESRKAFAHTGLDVDADAEITAARIRSSALGDKILPALDEWALAAFMLKREAEQEKLLHIARLADPDPAWANRLRDPAAWRDPKKLRILADDASTAFKPLPAHHFGILSTLLADPSEGIRLLREALRRRPNDFWLNWEMGKVYWQDGKFMEAAQSFRIVIALRPDNPFAFSYLGAALIMAGEFDEAIAQLRQGIKLDSKHTNLHRNLVIALIKAGRTNEALAASQRLLEADPTNVQAVFNVGISLAVAKQHQAAIPLFQKAIEMDPSSSQIHYNHGVALAMTGRNEEAVTAFRDAVKLDPTNVASHYGLGAVLLEIGKHELAIAEFEWIIREVDPKVKRGDAELGEGVYYHYARARSQLARALLCLGRFAAAQSAAQSARASLRLTQAGLDELGSYLVLCKHLLPLESKLPAILAGTAIPEDPATVRALAEWYCQLKRLPVAAVRLYDVVFAKQPSLADDLTAKHRFLAARAAALAGSGSGEDAAKLDAGAKAALRKKALEWLRADVDAWAKRLNNANGAELSFASRTAKGWELSKDLAGVRDPASLAKLSEAERQDWQTLWANVKELALRDPLERARSHVGGKQWAKAAEVYSQLINDGSVTPGDDVWFEYAGVQLLSGDRQGYRQTCKRMLDGATNALKMRPYLVARACTLAPDSVDDAELPTKTSAQELQQSANEFWSLTEQGALLYRLNRFKDAAPLFERSLKVEPRPGAAVVNWLWLALASHKLGDKEKARHWLDKAATWLDGIGDELPANADGLLGLHHHNWLEAPVLRREAQALIESAQTKGGTKEPK